MFKSRTVRCGKCKQRGHNRQTCGENLETPNLTQPPPPPPTHSVPEGGGEQETPLNAVSASEAYQILTTTLTPPTAEGTVGGSAFNKADAVKLGTSLADLQETTFKELTLTVTKRRERDLPESPFGEPTQWVDRWKFCEEEYRTPEGETVTVRYAFDEFPKIRSTITRLLLPKLSTLIFYIARALGLKKSLICQISYKKTTPNPHTPPTRTGATSNVEVGSEQEITYRIREGRVVEVTRMVDGVKHAEGRPALQRLNGVEKWYDKGKLSRLNAPAIVGGFRQSWWVDGKSSENDELCEKAASPETTLTELYELCTHPDPVVRKLAAHNPKSPEEWKTLIYIME